MYSTIVTVLLLLSGLSFVILLAKYVKQIHKGKPILPEIEEQDYEPVILIVRNTDSEPRRAIMFGFNKFDNEPNYGSHEDVHVYPSVSSLTYGQILRDSAICPFDVGLIRIKGTSEDDVKNTMYYYTQNIEGQEVQMPIEMVGHLQQQKDRMIKNILDVPFKCQINAETHIGVQVPPNTTIVYMFYPIRKYSLRGFLMAYGIKLPRLRGGMLIPNVNLTYNKDEN